MPRVTCQHRDASDLGSSTDNTVIVDPVTERDSVQLRAKRRCLARFNVASAASRCLSRNPCAGFTFSVGTSRRIEGRFTMKTAIATDMAQRPELLRRLGFVFLELPKSRAVFLPPRVSPTGSSNGYAPALERRQVLR